MKDPVLSIVHDYLIQMGGAERTVAAMVEAFPRAKLYTSVVTTKHLLKEFDRRYICTSWMQYLPMLEKNFKKYFFLYPLAFKTMRVVDGDVVWLSCSAFSKWIRVQPRTPVVAYIHTPPRFFWGRNEYLEGEISHTALRNTVNRALERMKGTDYRKAQELTFLVANSKCVKERIKKYYKRESTVIYPPVDIDRFGLSDTSEEYYLVVSRLVAYKRIDLAIKACDSLNRRLVVIGDGPDFARLRSLASEKIEFLGYCEEEIVEKFMRKCIALLFPGEEDFGIAPVEAQACGRPVIAFGAGGALETVINYTTGVLFNEPSVSALKDAILSLERCSWDTRRIRQNAERFSKKRFLRETVEFISDNIGVKLETSKRDLAE